MGFKKRALALVLATAVVFGSAFSAFAATDSKSTGTETTTSSGEANNHTKNTVYGKVSGGKATVTKVTAEDSSSAAKYVILKTYKKKPIAAIGKKAFAKQITKVKIQSKKTCTIKSQAFNSSKVKTLIVRSTVKIKKNAFKGTKAKKLTLNVKKASKLKLTKGAFNGIKKITIKGASSAQKKKIKKLLKKAGFKGTIK